MPKFGHLKTELHVQSMNEIRTSSDFGWSIIIRFEIVRISDVRFDNLAGVQFIRFPRLDRFGFLGSYLYITV